MAIITRDRPRTSPARPGILARWRSQEPKPVPALPDKVPALSGKPSHAEMVAAIVTEGRTSSAVAERLIQMLERARDFTPITRDGYIRGYKYYALNAAEMAVIHPVLELVIPDNANAKPFSAHDILNRGLLEGTKFIHGIAHDQCAILVGCV